MKRLVLNILVFCFVVLVLESVPVDSTVQALEKKSKENVKLEEIADALAIPFYNMQDEVISSMLKSYLRLTEFKAFQIFDPIADGERLRFSAWKKNDSFQILRNNNFPQEFIHPSKKVETAIQRDNFIIGKLVGYFESVTESIQRINLSEEVWRCVLKTEIHIQQLLS